MQAIRHPELLELLNRTGATESGGKVPMAELLAELGAMQSEGKLLTKPSLPSRRRPARPLTAPATGADEIRQAISSSQPHLSGE